MISVFSYLVSKQAPSVSPWAVGACPSSTVPSVPPPLPPQQLHHCRPFARFPTHTLSRQPYMQPACCFQVSSWECMISWQLCDILCTYFIFLATSVYTKLSSSISPVSFSVQGMHMFTSFCLCCRIQLYASYLRTITQDRHPRSANLGL